MDANERLRERYYFPTYQAAHAARSEHAKDSASRPLLPPGGIVVSRSMRDINGDGNLEAIDIVLVQGQWYYHMYVNGGGERWGGQFEIRVLKGERILSRVSLNRLWSREDSSDLWFRAPEFPLVFQDYNGDGQVDFNVGQNAGSQYTTVQMFTVRPGGQIEALTLARNEGRLTVSAGYGRNTAYGIEAVHGVISHWTYTGAGRGETNYWRWDGKQFVLLKSTVP